MHLQAWSYFLQSQNTFIVFLWPSKDHKEMAKNPNQIEVEGVGKTYINGDGL